MVGAVRSLISILLVSLLLSGVSLTKVVCIHLDTKIAHVEAVEVLDQGDEIHLGMDSFIPTESGKIKIALNSELNSQKRNFEYKVKNTRKPPYIQHFWRQPNLLRSVRLIT